MLIIEVPATRQAERAYVCDVVFREYLGLPYRLVPASRGDVRVTLRDDPEHRHLILADLFMQTRDEDWLMQRSVPREPFSQALLAARPLADVLAGPVPMLFARGAAEDHASETSTELLARADLLGGIFFLLTRYEEVANPSRDDHDRFSARLSVAQRGGFLDRPLADEYVEIIWDAISRTWPSLSRRETSYRLMVSHDVDQPLYNQRLPLFRALRSVGADLLRRRDPHLGVRRLQSWVDHHRGILDSDPFNTFDLIMTISELHGLRSAFYFLAGRLHPLDGNYDLSDAWIKTLLMKVNRRGHEIGLHGSYTTFRTSAQLRHELQSLQTTCATLGIQQSAWGARQHYLRWDNPTTWQIYADAGLSYDTTLSFADCAGFRCGTCREYPVFNLRTRQALPLREKPLIAMDVSLVGYEGLDLEKALERLRALKRACQRVRGDFTVLWHNSSLASKGEQDAYGKAIRLLAS